MEKEQDSSKIEGKFKLSLLQVERRMVDLETFVNELSEKLKGTDLTALPDLKQKVDDLEDLIMVENAGLLEIKKMLEEKGKPETKFDISDLEKKISDIEQKLSSLSEKPELQPTIEQMGNLKAEFEKRLKELQGVQPKPGVDLDFLTGRIDAVKASIDDLTNKKVESDLKLSELGKTINIIENKLGQTSSERLIEEIENNKKDLAITSSRMEAMEKVIKNMSTNMQQIESNLNKFESFEQLTTLGKEVEDKIERFKFIEGELRRLSARMEMLYDNIDKRLDKVKDAEKKVPEISNSIDKLARELDKNKIALIDRMKKEDVEKIVNELRNDEYRKLDEMKKRIDGIQNGINKKFGEIESRVRVRPEEKAVKQDELNKRLDELKSFIDRRIMELQPTTSIFDTQLNEVFDRLAFLESRLIAIESMMRETSKTLPIIIE